jgi:PAS domain S-box-containing protein
LDDREFISRIGPVFLDSYFIVDQDLKIQDFNQAFTQMLDLRGAERRKLTGSFCYEKLRLEICKDKCIAVEAMKKNAPIRMEEIRGTTPDGRELVLELSAIPLRDASGQAKSVFVTHRDVTDERRLKARYHEEQTEHRRERGALLRIIEDRDVENENLRQRLTGQNTVVPQRRASRDPGPTKPT